MSEAINVLFAIFGVLVILFLLYYFFGYGILRPHRQKQMKELAQRLNLEFKEYGEKKYIDKLLNPDLKKNIIKGIYSGEEVFIYDYDYRFYFYKKAGLFGLEDLPPEVSGRNIVLHLTCINGKYYKDNYLPYLSVEKIENFIKGKISLKEYRNKK